jgi:TrmH family RNA methyltransferase
MAASFFIDTLKFYLETMTAAEIITSPRNLLLREVARAAAKGSLTAESGLCLAEGLHLLDEALASGLMVPIVLCAQSMHDVVARRLSGLNRLRLAVAPDPWFEKLATTETTQGVMALVKPPTWTLDNIFRARSLVVVLDGLQDPGNAGAIVRAAEAFGATGVIFVKGSASAWHPKTLRASAGSLFRLPILNAADPDVALAAFAQRRVKLFAAVAHNGLPAHEQDLMRPCGFVIGSEAHGVSAQFAAVSEPIRIATAGVESLNASVAAAVLLYEASSQRRLGKK